MAALPWDMTCKVVSCGEPSIAEAPFELCDAHLDSWKRKLRDFTEPVHPWRVVMAFERWCVTEGRRLQLLRSLQKMKL